MPNPYYVDNSKMINTHSLPVWELNPKPQIVERNLELMEKNFGTIRLVTDYPKN